MFFLVRKTKAERGHVTCLRAHGKEQVQSFNLVLSTSNALSTILARYKGFPCITTHSFIQLTYIFEYVLYVKHWASSTAKRNSFYFYISQLLLILAIREKDAS